MNKHLICQGYKRKDRKFSKKHTINFHKTNNNIKKCFQLHFFKYKQANIE